MARKPARIERAGALTPRDRMWAAIRALAEARDPDTEAWFSIAEVLFLANLKGPLPIHPNTADTYFRGLAAAQPPYIQLADGERPAGRKRSELFLYRLVRDIGVDAPNVTKDGKPSESGPGNALIWTALKTLKEFNVPELVHAASTPERQLNAGSTKNYISLLARAGYLTVVATPKQGFPARYRFNRAKNTGPRAPLALKDKSVMDANTGEIVWPPKNNGAKQ